MTRGADLLSHRLMWLLVASSALCFAADVEWDYTGDNGPSHWAEVNPTEWQACAATSKSQSPINIDQDEATHKDIGHLQLSGYDNETSVNLQNNGHTVQLSDPRADMTVTGGELPGTYKLAQLHFHWGSDDTKGSEHKVDGNAYPLEIHFVHYDVSYKDAAEAMGHSNGLAVLGVFAKIGDKANEGLQKLLDKFGTIKYKDASATVPVEQFKVKSILPSNTNDFARYPGSLTTPPCSEVVVWTVFKEPIIITSEQMAQFRSLNKNKQNEQEEGEVNQLVDNFRPLQSLHDRTVYVTYSSAETTNNAHLRVSVAGCAAMLAWALLARY